MPIGPGKCVSRYVKRKTPSTESKNKKLKKVKKGIFPKGLVHGFDEKLAIFPSFYFRENWTAECV